MAAKKEKMVCGACVGSGGVYREVRDNSTGRWTKVRQLCSACKGKGWK